MTDQAPSDHAPATPKAMRKASDKSGRTRAREFAVQALYQHLVGQNPIAHIETFTRDLTGFHKADAVHFDALLTGCTQDQSELETLISPYLDRDIAHVSPIERGILLIAAFEFKQCLDVPLRVVINECIELAKSFGGTDGHKFINGVVHPLGQQLRPVEAKAS
jgi:N utilization substance protein B|tara:strand:- start:171 stop:659 length:489 start_codon:yes stop_codon:yes gene_type:complete